MTMIEFLCSLRKRTLLHEKQGILMETLCAIFLSFKEGSSINFALDKVISLEDKRILADFFVNKETDCFSKSFVNLDKLIRKSASLTCKSLLKGFLDLSLSLNKNVITEEPWNVIYIFPFLKIVKNKLCSFFKDDTEEQKRRKLSLLEVFEELLKATVHKNSFNKILYNS